jgi:hypothetical protein
MQDNNSWHLPALDRRQFMHRVAAGVGALSAGLLVSGQNAAQQRHVTAAGSNPEDADAIARLPYKGPNVILVRFGGGVRRQETIDWPEKTHCPFIYHELVEKQGILFKDLDIASTPGIDTSHGQGTLYLLTGRFDHYEDISHKPFADRFEAKVPTIFEYFRKRYDIPEHQALIINGEDRINEEFYTFSNHHLYGVRYRSTVLSLYRFKSYLLREELKSPALADRERAEKTKQLEDMVNKDYRVEDRRVASPELDRFWAEWRDYYGESGLVNPRGDRVLTALAVRALKQLRPRLLMINYQDPDYVHWGNPHFYTRAISIIDEGVREIYQAVQGDPEYRNNTVFLIVPDCGRNNNRCMSVAYQHHFNSKSAHQIFAVAAGPGIAHPRVAVDRQHQQIAVAAAVGKIMQFPTEHVDSAAGCLAEMFA